MAGVIGDPPGFPYTPPGVDVLEGGKLTSNNVAGSSHNPKAVYPLHRCLVDGDGCVFSALSPEIHHQLLGLVDVE